MIPSPQPPSPPSARKQSPLTAFAKCILCIWIYLAKDVDDPNAERKADALLVAASVIAAMNFQAAISPPGGAYQDTRYNGTVVEYQAGQSIAAYVARYEFKRFSIVNTVSFTFSMTTMFLFLSGLSFQRRIFSILLMGSMFATFTATTYSYKLAMEATTPDHDKMLLRGWKFINHLVNVALYTWFVVAGVAIVVFVGMQLKVPVTNAFRRATVKA